MDLGTQSSARLPLTLRIPRASLRLAGTAGLVVLLATSVVLAVDAAAAPSLLVPGAHRAFPGWMAGPLAGLGEPTDGYGLGVLLTLMLGAWLVVLATARAVPARVLAGAIVSAHVIFLLAPPMFSADVFGYIGFARVGAVHHADPYVFGTGWFPSDPVHQYLRWHNAHSPYGPVFTVLSYALVPLGVAGGLWAFKVLAFGASLATVALVWRTAERLGRDGRSAAVLVGLSPPLLAFEVAGGHNDALVLFAAVAGIALVLERREAAGMAALVLSAAMKLSGGIVAPFAFLGSRDRRGAALGIGVAAAAVVLVAVVAFGGGATGSLSSAAQAGGGTATFSVPSTVARALGAGPISDAARTGLTLAVAAVLLWMLVRAARGADWIVCAGWATLAVVCGSTWLLPWYATWVTPLAALGDSRRLRVATVLLVAFVTLTRVQFLRV